MVRYKRVLNEQCDETKITTLGFAQ